MLDAWLPFLFYAALAAAIPLSLLLASFVFATKPARPTRARTLPFESGVSEGPPKQDRFSVNFYMVAILFIAFDIEVVFLYPLAVVLGDYGWYAFWAFAFYIGMLALALVYDWRKGALDF